MLRFISLFGVAILAAFAGCSSAPRGHSHPTPFPQANDPAQLKVSWSKKIDGYLADLRVTPQGHRILLVTRALDQSIYRLLAYDDSGSLQWEFKHAERATSVDLFADGKLVVAAFKDGTLRGIDDSGHELFVIERRCQVVALNDGFLCYRTERSTEPVLLELYDRSGKKIRIYSGGVGPAGGAQALRSVQVSQDRKNIALVFKQNKLHLLREDLTPVWKKTIPGEIADVDVAPDRDPQVAIVINSVDAVSGKLERSGQHWALLDATGKVLFKQPLSLNTQGVRFSTELNPLYFYGNGSRGQYVAASYGPHETWKHQDPVRALFVTPPIALREGVLVGIEDQDPETQKRHAHLFAFGVDGEELWNLPLSSPHHAYFKAVAYEGHELKLYVATEDSVLTAYELR